MELRQRRRTPATSCPTRPAVEGGALQFREQGTLPHPNATPRLRRVRRLEPDAVRRRGRHGGQRPPRPAGHERLHRPGEAQSCATTGRSARARAASCATRSRVPAGGSQTLWIAVAGSDKGPGEARSELNAALSDPAGALAAKIADRERWATRTRLSLPGDRRLQDAVDWGKQNVLDLTRRAEDLKIRWLDQGRAVHGAAGHRGQRPLGRRRLPGLPVDVRHRRRVHGVRERRDGPVRARSRTTCVGLRDVSEILNDGSGDRDPRGDLGRLELVRQDQRNERNGVYNFNTDETVKFPSAVALVWRWTGDDAFRDDLYDFAVRGHARRGRPARRGRRRLARGLGQRRARAAWASRSSTTPST